MRLDQIKTSALDARFLFSCHSGHRAGIQDSNFCSILHSYPNRKSIHFVGQNPRGFDFFKII